MALEVMPSNTKPLSIYMRDGQRANFRTDECNRQYDEPDSKVDNDASWSSLKRLQSSCQVS